MKQIIEYNGSKCLAQITNENDHIQKYWMLNRYYETQRNGMLNFIFAQEKTGGKWIDIGASIGNHTLFFKSVMKADVIHSIEPYKPSFDHLTKNVALNKWEGINLHHLAIGEKVGSCSMTLTSKDNVGMAQVTEGVDVSVMPLDALPFITGFNVMKIDIEHYNEELLIGGKKTFTKGKGSVYIEAETPEMLELTDSYMKDYGYTRLPGIILNHTPTYVYRK